MKNPTITLKLGKEEILKIDLWTLILLYAPKKSLESWNSFRLFLNNKEVEKNERD